MIPARLVGLGRNCHELGDSGVSVFCGSLLGSCFGVGFKVAPPEYRALSSGPLQQHHYEPWHASSCISITSIILPVSAHATTTTTNSSWYSSNIGSNLALIQNSHR